MSLELNVCVRIVVENSIRMEHSVIGYTGGVSVWMLKPLSVDKEFLSLYRSAAFRTDFQIVSKSVQNPGIFLDFAGNRSRLVRSDRVRVAIISYKTSKKVSI